MCSDFLKKISGPQIAAAVTNGGRKDGRALCNVLVFEEQEDWSPEARTAVATLVYHSVEVLSLSYLSQMVGGVASLFLCSCPCCNRRNIPAEMTFVSWNGTEPSLMMLRH